MRRAFYTTDDDEKRLVKLKEKFGGLSVSSIVRMALKKSYDETFNKEDKNNG